MSQEEKPVGAERPFVSEFPEKPVGAEFPQSNEKQQPPPPPYPSSSSQSQTQPQIIYMYQQDRALPPPPQSPQSPQSLQSPPSSGYVQPQQPQQPQPQQPYAAVQYVQYPSQPQFTPQSQQIHVVSSTMTTVPAQIHSHVPVRITCPQCNNDIITNVTETPGTTAYLWAFIIFLIFFPLMWVPFVLPGCLDKTHSCPVCRTVLAYIKV